MFPAASLLLTIYAYTGESRFDFAAFCCLVFAVVASPFLYFSGFWDWNKRFHARKTRIFNNKIILGAVLTVLAFGLVLWKIFFPHLLEFGGAGIWLYIITVYSATCIVVYLGHLGSRFI